MEIRVADDGTAAAVYAAHWIARRARDAVRRRGRFTLAVSGGGTPVPMFVELDGLDVPWAQTTIFQVDERVAADGSPDRNATQLAEHLPAAFARGTVRLMPVTSADLRRAATRYATRIGDDDVIDVVHLGIGDDGHTASWPPDHPVGDLTGDGVPKVAVVGPFNGLMRMTLTPPVVNAARSRLVVVDGGEKADVVERWMLDDRSLPITRVRRTSTWVILDAAAAARLSVT